MWVDIEDDSGAFDFEELGVVYAVFSISRDNYESLVRISSGDMPPHYAAWADNLAMAKSRLATDDDWQIYADLDVLPEEFSQWCVRYGHNPDKASREAFAIMKMRVDHPEIGYGTTVIPISG